MTSNCFIVIGPASAPEMCYRLPVISPALCLSACDIGLSLFTLPLLDVLDLNHHHLADMATKELKTFTREEVAKVRHSLSFDDRAQILTELYPRSTPSKATV